MAKNRPPRAASPAAAPDRSGVTAERFARLHRLLLLLARKPQPREALARQLRLDVRGFYRDLELLRTSGIRVTLEKGRYELADDTDEAAARLPFPDPHLTLGEARQLAKGRSAVHRKLQAQIDRASEA
jgi:predicted DNA-binding transcriptional regulator YafY